jgi:hypothetical protein
VIHGAYLASPCWECGGCDQSIARTKGLEDELDVVIVAVAAMRRKKRAQTKRRTADSAKGETGL